jgi:hypothetical protein
MRATVSLATKKHCAAQAEYGRLAAQAYAPSDAISQALICRAGTEKVQRRSSIGHFGWNAENRWIKSATIHSGASREFGNIPSGMCDAIAMDVGRYSKRHTFRCHEIVQGI